MAFFELPPMLGVMAQAMTKMLAKKKARMEAGAGTSEIDDDANDRGSGVSLMKVKLCPLTVDAES